jgi:hypothetical protein
VSAISVQVLPHTIGQAGNMMQEGITSMISRTIDREQHIKDLREPLNTGRPGFII